MGKRLSDTLRLLREHGVRYFETEGFKVEFTDRAFIEKPIAEYVNMPSDKAVKYDDQEDLRFWSAE